MNYTPVNTYGLCEGFQRGDKFKVREEVDTASHFFETGAEVTIANFDEKPPPQCKNDKAKLLIFKDREDSQWHPLWIIDCRKCPFYDPEWSWSCADSCRTKG